MLFVEIIHKKDKNLVIVKVSKRHFLELFVSSYSSTDSVSSSIEYKGSIAATVIQRP